MGGGSPVARRQARSHHPLLERRRRTRHRVDARLESHQEPGAEPAFDLVGAQPQLDELPAGDEAAPFGGQLLDRRIQEHGYKESIGVRQEPSLWYEKGRDAPLFVHRRPARW